VTDQNGLILHPAQVRRVLKVREVRVREVCAWKVAVCGRIAAARRDRP